MNKPANALRAHCAKLLQLPPTRFKTCSVQRAQAQFDKLLADVEAGCVIDITRRGRAIASILSNSKLETLEILANPDALRVLRADKGLKVKKPKAQRGKGTEEIP